MEFDVVVYWDGQLILIEAKCSKSVYEPYDIYRAKNQVLEAVDQLKRRKEAVIANWSKFRALLPNLNLPVEMPQQQDIKLIAVTNVLHFTPWKKDDVIVTDEFCLRCFFENKYMSLYSQQKVIKSLAQVRLSSKPNVKEFLEYLITPPQFELLKRHVSEYVAWLPAVKENHVIGKLYTHSEPSKAFKI